MEDVFFTFDTVSEGLYKEKGSKFMAFAMPVATEAEAKEKVAYYKETYADARHICYAYVLLGGVCKSTDDGEPSGTAGKPILNQLFSAKVEQVLVVVIRYFGGTKLGVPGLIHAYKGATLAAIQGNTIVQKYHMETIGFRCAYADINKAKNSIAHYQGEILASAYAEESSFTIAVRSAWVGSLKEALSLYGVIV